MHCKIEGENQPQISLEGCLTHYFQINIEQNTSFTYDTEHKNLKDKTLTHAAEG